jgi:deoxyadenosine/deoxycytidine kinase
MALGQAGHGLDPMVGPLHPDGVSSPDASQPEPEGEKEMKKFIAVAGNVGVGKSTLTRMLSDHLCWEPFFEAVDDNPYLADFYKDMRTWAFHSQIFFLSKRLSHHGQIIKRPGTVVQDRTVYEDASIFARNLHLQGHMGDRDWESYWDLYQTVITILPPPDLVIYLQASVPVLQERIRARGRDYEQQIAAEYLTQLNDLYEEWVDGFTLCPVLTVETDNLNPVADNSHLELIASRTLDKLHGKETVVFDKTV